MNIEFIVERIGKLKTDIAAGTFTIYESGKELFKHGAASGGWGKGYLPIGDYKITYLVPKKEGSYTLFGFGWFAGLMPQFETDRTELGVHPDGNVEGSLGCIVLPFKSLEDNIKCHNLIRDGLGKGVIDVKCLEILSH